jgi:NAD(P)-dependent dehydrogenase (short-subunit alcohol dehydrogenase family)
MLSGVQNALIIGASSVVGRALARILASRGYNVGLAARRLDLLRAVANEIHTMPFRRPRHAWREKAARLRSGSQSAKRGFGGAVFERGDPQPQPHAQSGLCRVF